jgi:hypothetical protein
MPSASGLLQRVWGAPAPDDDGDRDMPASSRPQQATSPTAAPRTVRMRKASASDSGLGREGVGWGEEEAGGNDDDDGGGFDELAARLDMTGELDLSEAGSLVEEMEERMEEVCGVGA